MKTVMIAMEVPDELTQDETKRIVSNSLDITRSELIRVTPEKEAKGAEEAARHQCRIKLFEEIKVQ
jgi:hypothetical protein